MIYKGFYEVALRTVDLKIISKKFVFFFSNS